jgi:hypothetical protein
MSSDFPDKHVPVRLRAFLAKCFDSHDAPHRGA